MTELLYQLALTQVPNIGDVQAKLLVQHFGEASAIFKARKKILESIDGIGAVRAASIHSFTNFEAAEKEMRFLEQYKIKPLFLTDAAYPQRLLHCTDAPALIFYKGGADLNTTKILAIACKQVNLPTIPKRRWFHTQRTQVYISLPAMMNFVVYKI